MESNFVFLKDEFPSLEKLGTLAENYLYTDPDSSILKMGKLAEVMVKDMLHMDGIEWSKKEEDTHASRIRLLKQNDMLPRDIDNILYVIRKERNLAAHDAEGTTDTCKKLLQMSHTLCVWFMQIYGDFNYKPSVFVVPTDKAKQSKELEQQHQALLAEHEKTLLELEQAKANLPAVTSDGELAVKIATRRQLINKVTASLNLSEAETRLLIDEQLEKASWKADSVNLRYSKGTRPQKGKNLAIAEWPTSSKVSISGSADYALFVGLKLVGIIEAKATHKDIYSVIDHQCADYSKHILPKDEPYIIDELKDSEFKVPFLFATNGKPYLEQLKVKSGIWFRDSRKNDNISKALPGFYSPQGLEELLGHDTDTADAKLETTSYDILEDKDGINLRPYQIDAIKHVEQAIINGKTEALLAMATGTGKTRTILGMIYRFLESKRFKRILFLVDRTTLGEQAGDTFKEVKLDGVDRLMTLDEIFPIKNLDDKFIDKETKIHISTVQGMVTRIMHNDEKAPAVSDYDLIIIDEAHRGYTLDKEISDDEQLYLDQEDFKSKYRMVIDYFDAVKIALTATPALHTTTIFGEPVYEYTYRQAVIDGFLVDHDVPHEIVTKLRSEGIKYAKGDTVAQYDPLTGEVNNTSELPDELNFGVEDFNKDVINQSFNETVLQEIANNLNPEAKEDGKTLIFAVDDNHADMIVSILRNIYRDMGLPHNAIMKITGSVGGGNPKKVLEAVKTFKNETYPNIAVTVDLLTTGIDVPEITTLVFMRRIRSRILFEQMLGRGTRLCPEINKTHFEIYDPVGVYESLQPVSTMKPVVQDVSKSFVDLLGGLEVLEPEKLPAHIDSLKAKLQRKLKNMTDEQKDHFADMAGMVPEAFIETMTNLSADDLLDRQDLFKYLDTAKAYNPRKPVISSHKDELISHTRGYGNGQSPEDYLEEFGAFIKENINTIMALNIVSTKPSELTRESLKSLTLELQRNGYTTQFLNTAWKDAKNEEIAADIIAHIRRQTLGSPLLSTEERIKQGVKKLIANNNFTKIQKDWLARMEKALIDEIIIDKATFNSGSFKSFGGFATINKKYFGGKLDDYMDELNSYLYDSNIKGA